LTLGCKVFFDPTIDFLIIVEALLQRSRNDAREDEWMLKLLNEMHIVAAVRGGVWLSRCG
jgi:hypothetical protein